MKQTRKYRQGDVMFIRRESAPSGEMKKRDNGIVAYGEVTGHAHRLADTATAGVFECGSGLVVRVSEEGIAIDGNAGASFVHEEHGTVSLPPGDYYVMIQREYSPVEIRNVVD